MMQDRNRRSGSDAALARARRRLPDGVSRITIASARPLYMDSGSGAYVTDVDGNRYVDFNNNFTALIHGHAFPPVVDAICATAKSGTCFANPVPDESGLADLIVDRVPSIEQLRFVNTGTEAVMFAIKAARALTGRPAIAKFEGAYHGGYDWAEVSEDSGPHNWGTERPLSTPPYRGAPQSVMDEVVALPFNDIALTREILTENTHRLAAVLVDMMPSRAGLIAIEQDYIDFLRAFTHQHGIILINDEVLNFRQGFGGAAQRFGLEADLTTFGKIIGGGLPIGAVGGSTAMMSVFAIGADGAAVPQGGTFSANPLSISAGLTSMRHLTQNAIDTLNASGDSLRERLNALFEERGLPLVMTGYGSLLRVHVRTTAPRNYREAWIGKEQAVLLAGMTAHFQDAGVIFPVKAAATLSTAMVQDDFDQLVNAFATLRL